MYASLQPAVTPPCPVLLFCTCAPRAYMPYACMCTLCTFSHSDAATCFRPVARSYASSASEAVALSARARTSSGVCPSGRAGASSRAFGLAVPLVCGLSTPAMSGVLYDKIKKKNIPIRVLDEHVRSCVCCCCARPCRGWMNPDWRRQARSNAVYPI